MGRRGQLRWTWCRALGIGPLLMLAAFLPSLTYIDHWPEHLGLTAAAEAVEEPAEHVRHAGHNTHCHFGPSSCSNQPMIPAAQVLPAVVDLPQPRLAATPLEDVASRPAEVFLTTPTEPPRV